MIAEVFKKNIINLGAASVFVEDITLYMITNWYIFSYFYNSLPFVYLVSTNSLLMELWHLWTRFSNIPNYLVFIHIYSNYINWIINK